MPHFKIVLPKGEIDFVDKTLDSSSYERSRQIKQMCVNAAYKHNYSASRKDPQEIVAKIYNVTLHMGKTVETFSTNVSFTPPLARMTIQDYEEEMKSITKELPEEFVSFVERQAWDDGHAYGYEEVCNIACNIVSNLMPRITEYNKRMGIKDE